MKRQSLKKEFFYAAAFLLATALLLNFISDVLRPARVDYGSTWSAYRAEPKNSIDVLYLGSSYAYCDVNPAQIYAASGLTGFVMAGSEQTMAATYWYLKEALKTQKPQAVVLEGTSVFFHEYQNYTQINVGYMPFGANKLGAIFTAAEPELRFGLLFDLYFYHDRWKEIRFADIKKALLPIRRDHFKGYTAVDRVWDAPQLHPREPDRLVYEENLAWMGKILTLCAENDILPILTFNPTYSRAAPEEYERVEAAARAACPGVLFRNWTEDFEALGLNPTLHLYDEGHLNQDGAAVFSRFLGDFLTGEAGLVPRPQSEKSAAAWDEAAAYWSEILKE